MKTITRRLFLRNTTAVGAVAVTAASSPAAAASSPLDRIHRAVEELRSAMQAYAADRDGSWSAVIVGNRPGGKPDIVSVTCDGGCLSWGEVV